MNKRKSFSMNVGSTSILLIFIVLALVSFAALSLSSALADYKLSAKAASKSKHYYAAVSEAEKKLAAYNTEVSKDAGSMSKEAFSDTYPDNMISFTVPISGTQELFVILETSYEGFDDGSNVRVNSFKEYTIEENIIFDDVLNVVK